ncbi:hypothetical protein FRC10_006137 [Ceratobasidium sp. 414]|nr:hypothetical protein FRC10_006137 [Ceratobasidium sp. 414]
MHEIILHLTSSGCQNLTSQLDPVSFSAQPVARGGFGDVYCGALRDNRKVAIKVLRVPLDPDDELDKVPKHESCTPGLGAIIPTSYHYWD